MLKFVNNWSSVLTGELSIGGATLPISSPALDLLGLAVGDECILTLAEPSVASAADVEIVRLSRDGASTYTLERGLEGTTARDWPAETLIYAALTAGVMAQMLTGPKSALIPGTPGTVTVPAGVTYVRVQTPAAAQDSVELLFEHPTSDGAGGYSGVPIVVDVEIQTSHLLLGSVILTAPDIYDYYLIGSGVPAVIFDGVTIQGSSYPMMLRVVVAEAAMTIYVLTAA